MHFFGSLAKTAFGCEYLDRSGFIPLLSKQFNNLISSKTLCEEDVFHLKALIWVFSHIGSSEEGYKFLSTVHGDNIIKDIIKLTTTCDIFSLRG
jgi:hypothetical protein